MKPIKVVMLGPYVSSFECGGVAVHINKLTEHLANRDNIVLHLITLGKINNTYKINNMYIHELKRISPPIGSFSIIQIRSLMHKINEINPDIVHAQGTFLPYSTAVSLIRNKYPTLLTVHGTAAKEMAYCNGPLKYIPCKIQMLNERYVVSKILNLIVVSPLVKDLIGKMTDSKIHIIPNGIDMCDIIGMKHGFINFPSILCIGRLQREKGFDILLKAVPIIRHVYSAVRIYIAGSGPQMEELKKLAGKLNISDCVEFLGFLSDQEKYRFYKSVDLCVVPSRFDAGPVVLPEAMACGTVVVASNVGGIPFMIEHELTGLLFESENENDLAEKVIILLNNKNLRSELSNAANKKILELTWDKIADRTYQVYKEIHDNPTSNR